MNKKYNIICYKLNKSVKPADVLGKLEALIEKYSAYYSECLLELGIWICELEHEGKFYSNRDKNAIKTILKWHPELELFYKYNCEQKNVNDVFEEVLITNYSFEDFSCAGEIEYSLIRHILNKIPRPYGVNNLELIYNGISFKTQDNEGAKISHSKSGFDCPVGNYIWYSRSKHGDEKHSYVYFSIDDENLATMRKLFLEFAETISGKYEGTEYRS